MSEFKNIVKALRAEHSITQESLAESLGIGKSTVAMWETGKRIPSPELYELVADFFNVDIDYLFGKQTVRRKIAIEDIEAQADLISTYAFNIEAAEYLKMLDEMPLAFRSICYDLIKSIYDSWKKITDL